MRSLNSLINFVLIPALIGGLVALSILLWAPEAVQLSDGSTTANALNTAPTVEQLAQSKTATQFVTSYADAVEQAAPAVVNIYTRTIVRRERHPIFDDPLFQRFFGIQPEPSERVQSSLGSGVIMSDEGYVLTNNHVISGADKIVVALRDGREANAQVVGTDPESDLALLQIELADIPVIKITDAPLRVGDVVLAIGNPFGVGQTVTMGIVSATGRNHLGLSTYENYIQTDAAINPGNSGGALVNAYGELVGLNTAIYSKSGGNMGIGFAIPVAIAERTVNDIIEHGSAIRGWLGIEVQESTPALLNALELPEALTGLIVTGINPNGPADKSGLNIGDIIVKLNESEADNAQKAMNQIAAVRPGEKIKIDYLRAGKRFSTETIAGQRKP